MKNNNTNDWRILMDIENLYDELIHILRTFTNSINRNNADEKEVVTSTLSDIINRIAFTMKDDLTCKSIEIRLIREFRKLSKEMFVKTTNKTIYLEKIQKNIDYLTWVNKNRKLNLNARKYTVAQKEIFYAYLGNNIGSEQNGHRPVIILQNDKIQFFAQLYFMIQNDIFKLYFKPVCYKIENNRVFCYINNRTTLQHYKF